MAMEKNNSRCSKKAVQNAAALPDSSKVIKNQTVIIHNDQFKANGVVDNATKKTKQTNSLKRGS